jgi:putative hydroxymethylpyrimidine transport system substrate-binding protein
MKRLNLLLATWFFSTASIAAEPVTVLLDWFINPDHAQLILARELGYFDAEDLSVELIEPVDPSLPPRMVAAGKADVAISYQPQLHVQVSEGLPLSRFGTLISTPLNSLVVLADGPVKSIQDLKGRKVGFSVGGFEDALLRAMLQSASLSLNDIELVNVNFSLSPALITGQVDAVIGAFRNFELNQLDIEGYAGQAFYPEEHGVPPYDELILVTNNQSRDSAWVIPFLRAIERATLYLVNHSDEAWEVFRDTNPEMLDNELNRRAWRDTLHRFALRPAALDTRRYTDFARFLQAQGLIESMPDIDSYAYEAR